MKRLRLICILVVLGICQHVFGASPIQETNTPTSYTMRWNETGKNGGTVNGIFSGPMKDGKRNGRWTANVKFNLFGDDDFRSGTITMTRNYTNGVPDGPYTYNFDVNWRDGAYNPYQGKWIYGAPRGYKETVSGAFKMGRPDGVWSIKSDKKLGYECSMTFKNGIPVGKRVYIDGINGKGNEEFNEEGLLISRYSDEGNGWRYKDASSIPLEKRVQYNLQKFFHLETEDDYNYFAHAGELYSWLTAYPYGASDEKISYEGYVIEEGEDLDFIEYIGSPEYIKKYQAANEQKKVDKILKGVYNELYPIHQLYSDSIDKCERKAPTNVCNEAVSLYMAKCNRLLLDSLSPSINRIEEIPLVQEIMAGKDGAYGSIIKEYLSKFRELNQIYSPENIESLEARLSRFLRNGRKVCEELNIDPSIITDEDIEKYYDGQNAVFTNMYYHIDDNESNTYSKKQNLDRLMREKRRALKDCQEEYQPDIDMISNLEDELSSMKEEYDDLLAMEGCNVISENTNKWVQYVNRKGVKKIVSPSDITFRDFVLYVAPRSLEKPKKESWPSYKNLIGAMNAIRRIIPERISLARISRNVTMYNSAGFAYDTRKELLSNLDEKKLKKLWKEYAKHYGIPVEK